MTRKLAKVACCVVLGVGTAEAQGLSRARTVMQSFQGELLSIVPIVAVIALILLAILWGCKAIRFVDLCRWGGGVLIVGCASQLVSMLMS